MSSLIRTANLSAGTYKLGVTRKPAAAPAALNPGTAPAPLLSPANPAANSVKETKPVQNDLISKSDMQALLSREVESLRKTAEQAGYSAGYSKGLAEAKGAASQHADNITELVHSIRHSLSVEIDGVEDVAIEIAYAAVCKMLGKSLPTLEGVRAMVGEMIKHAKQSEKLTVRVAPADYRLIENHLDELIKNKTEADIEFVPDEQVGMGGCLVESASGTLDGRLERQIELLRNTLVQARSDRQKQNKP
jgi:flagellar assembly protein FliH